MYLENSLTKKSLRWCQCLKASRPERSSEIPVGVAGRDSTGQLLSHIRLQREEEQEFILSEYRKKQLQTPNTVYTSAGTCVDDLTSLKQQYWKGENCLYLVTCRTHA